MTAVSIWRVLQWPIAFALIVFAVDLVYYFAPNADTEWVWVTPGSLLSTSVWLLASIARRLPERRPADAARQEWLMSVLRNYVLLQVPGWAIAAVVLWLAYRWGAISLTLAAVLFAFWVAKDFVLFPVLRRFYMPEPAERRILRERGTAVTALAPDGFVRVHGELWQARSDTHVEAGAPIRVRDIDGLLLHVTPE